MPDSAAPNEPGAPDVQSMIETLPLGADGTVIGAPGTGKTHTAVARMVRLLRDPDIAAASVLMLTPSRRSATRLRDEVSLRAGVATPGAPVRSIGSLAFQIVRAAMVHDGAKAPQLLTGADQDRLIADLLAGDSEDEAAGRGRWPAELGAAARASRDFRSELRTLIAECTELGVSTAELRAVGTATDREVWVAAADFIEDYRDVVAQLRAEHRDAADLMAEAAALLRSTPLGEAGVARIGSVAVLRAVIIDDAQELTVGALELVSALRSRGVAVLAFGDPDIGSGAFRGVSAGLFAHLTGMLDQLWVLEEPRRSTSALTRLTRTVTASIGVAGRVEHRRPPGPVVEDDRVQVVLADSGFQEVDVIARTLRRWHVLDGIEWHELAVIAHDTRQVAALETELAAREVPTRAAGVQRPLGRDRAARALLELIELAAVAPGERDPERVEAALLSPFGGLDAIGLRRLRAALRHRELAEGGATPAAVLLRDAMAHPLDIGALEVREARVAERLATTVALLQTAVERGDTVHELLWLAWDRARIDGRRLADQWREDAAGVGPEAAEADVALDALVALFEAAKRSVERNADADPLAFIRDTLHSDVPEDTLVGVAPGTTVTVLTPATALGTEFEGIVIAGVQDGVWPNVRPRGGMLQTWALRDAVSAIRAGGEPVSTGFLDRRREALSDELRLFVRAISRARTRLLVTAVDDDASGPSALFAFLPDPIEPEAAHAHPLTLRGLVAQHRRTLTSHPAPAAATHAAGQLRLLAEAGVAGADPQSWYGVAGPSSTGPLRDPERRPVPVSPSTIERFETCGIDWAVRALGGDTRSWSGGLGTILHAAMETVPDGDLERLQQVIDERWSELDFEAAWLSEKERRWARTLVQRLHAYLARFQRADAACVGAEASFQLSLPLRDDVTAADVAVVTTDTADVTPPEQAYAMLRGSIDRVEVYPPGAGEDVPQDPDRPTAPRVLVADLKTGRGAQKYRDEHVRDDAQLSAYQLAVRSGAVPGVTEDALAGARLIVLSMTLKGTDYRFATQPALSDADADAFVRRVVADARLMAAAHVSGDVDAHCSVDPFAVCGVHTVKPVSAS